MDRDRKSPGLKMLQGHIWEHGYRAGVLKGEVFSDVPPALPRWREARLDVAIYSSGSELRDTGTVEPRPIPTSWMCDMDGVLVHEGQLVPGADDFLNALRSCGRTFLVLTNNSIHSARDLSARLGNLGLDVPPESLWTSAQATAAFLASQRPGGTAFVVGEAGLTTALHEAGYVLTDLNPDYVVLGETRTYSFEAITRAIRLVERGARFIATNPDAGP